MGGAWVLHATQSFHPSCSFFF
uniref:Uncharacterized protein n=1 Tax=Anguilla anguilla TaxID=7936 RepID=A0A0E9RDU6_ANGAN